MPVKKMTLDGKQLTIEGELVLPGEVSQSGKSNIVLSTGGFVDVPDSEYRINLTVIKPKRIRLGNAGV